MAWTRKILRVDLGKGTCADEPLNMEWARKYLGQRGLATKYLVEEVDPRVDPLAPGNTMIMATGPLTGTCASTAGRYSVITKGALTGAIACSNSGGFFGNEMKNAGYDMIIFEGKAKSPVYLFIQNGQARLLDAGDLWGTSVWDTEEGIKAKHQDPLIRVASIGVAGEKGVKFAGVINDMHRAAGRSGVGAVMGSKNLKAVAIRGTLGVQVDDYERFMEVTRAGKKILAENAVTGEGLPTFGTQVLMNVINEVGALPTRNHREVMFESANDISAEAMAKIATATEEAGRSLKTYGSGHLLFARVDDSYEKALDAATATLSTRYGMDFRKAAQRYAALGSAAEVAAKIEEFYDAGMREVIVDLVGPYEERNRLIERFAAEVAPAVAAACEATFEQGRGAHAVLIEQSVIGIKLFPGEGG